MSRARTLMSRALMSRGRAAVIALPMVWLGLFFALPFLIVAKISLSDLAIAQPPYLPLAEWADGTLRVVLNFGNYLFLAQDGLYIAAYLELVRIAAVSTLVTLLIGYPMAYVIALSPPARRSVLLMSVVLPFWTSFLLRVYAWIGFLSGNGLVNQVLLALGVIDAPLVLMQIDLAVQIGIVYTYLPFMILPLYATLTRLTADHREAAADLGATPATVFLTITLPLSLGGVMAGCLLVFIPAVGEFVIPALLGGPDTLMIGRVLWDEFFSNRDWPMAAAVAVVMLLILIGPIVLLRRVQDR